MFREADAVWKDGPYAGRGTVSVPSGILSNTHYVFGLAETTGCTTPGEMLAAAIASSMSTTVVLKMAKLGAQPAVVETHAVVSLDDLGDKWKITAVHLEITAKMLDAETSCFEEAVEAARRDCPIASELNLDVVCSAKLIPLGEPIVT